ncbi:MAG TPA: N-methyl-L-tryptophan oxidase [Verrucomicrobiales bacterium]|mgnify:CR=1 FL=1|nr:N-methyl-L-tryptophan oxidase [Verrucomicrobiales bacterium]
MTRRPDVIIAGLGAMGSAAAHHLASRGLRVLGLDRFTPPHTQGSSHGRTRIIREAYFEHPLYVPIVQRAYDLWDELQREAGRPLLQITGGLMIGPPGGPLYQGARTSARQHRLSHELLEAREVRRRFPALQPTDDLAAVWEPRAGILFPEECISAHLRLAAARHAELHFDEPVLRWEPDGEGVRVETGRGTYRASHLVISAGPWARSLLNTTPEPPLQVERQVLLWLGATGNPGAFAPERCPIHLWQTPGGEYFYGFPNLGDGVKLACHHSGTPTTPEEVCREVLPADEAALRAHVRAYLPDANGPVLSGAVCLYTNTPDAHFWIDRHPLHPQVRIVSPCSGHGFKFASAIGEIVAEEVTGVGSRFDLSLFRSRGSRAAQGA